jgi:hypothetical protein
VLVRTAFLNQSTQSSGIPVSITLALSTPTPAPTPNPASHPTGPPIDPGPKCSRHGSASRLQIGRLSNPYHIMFVLQNDDCVSQRKVSPTRQSLEGNQELLGPKAVIERNPEECLWSGVESCFYHADLIPRYRRVQTSRVPSPVDLYRVDLYWVDRTPVWIERTPGISESCSTPFSSSLPSSLSECSFSAGGDQGQPWHKLTSSTLPADGGLANSRRERHWRRGGTVGLAVVLAIGLTGRLGVHTSTKHVSADGPISATLVYPDVIRPGLAVAWRLELGLRPDGTRRTSGRHVRRVVRISSGWVQCL